MDNVPLKNENYLVSRPRCRRLAKKPSDLLSVAVALTRGRNDLEVISVDAHTPALFTLGSSDTYTVSASANREGGIYLSASVVSALVARTGIRTTLYSLYCSATRPEIMTISARAVLARPCERSSIVLSARELREENRARSGSSAKRRFGRSVTYKIDGIASPDILVTSSCWMAMASTDSPMETGSH